VCIVYEHSLFAHGIKRLLQPQKGLRIVGMIERPELSTRDLHRLRPDVVVVEGNGSMAVMESLEGVTALAISLRGDEATILSGLPVRVAAPEDLAGAIRHAARHRGRGPRRTTR
jgi:DNA-binding NarL/FixJ family response regulator